ncbi:hypothetical protein V501_05591 [Pseudogymnoascus sp. VKM F-4519 (FW-2642)]|nr:hypothetical protein V501_05591 [Pseudogymnoascus sp. VKM F-4519 (FW-2642)]
MASNPTLPMSGPDEEFLKSHELFFSALSGNDRSQFKSCKSPEELLEEVKTFSRFKDQKGSWARPIMCIQKFSDSLAPLGGSEVDIVAHNFTSFFDKLTEILDEIGRTIPHYQEILTLASGDLSTRFQLRRTPVVISQLLWKPFSVRYINFVKRLDFHRDVLKDEEDLMRTKALFQTLYKIKMSQDETLHEVEEQRQQDDEYKSLLSIVHEKVSAAELKNIRDSVKDWLQLPSSGDIQEPLWDAQRLRDSNTGTWIFDDNQFVAWHQSNPSYSDQCHPLSNTLWVRGNPGTGKSVLAASVLDWLGTSGRHDGDQNQALAYFFFSFRSPPTRRLSNAYREILSQIFQQLQENTAVLDCFNFVADKSATSCASIKDILALLKLLARHIPRFTLLFDGLDESDDPDDLIKSLAKCFSGTPAKMIFFSRPNVPALMAAPRIEQITLLRHSVEADIRIYLSHRLEGLQEKLPPSYPKEKILTHLLDSANGMFLWARLMMDYLDSPALDLPETRLATISETTQHETLNDMYIRILQHIGKKTKPEIDMARRILYWLSFYARPIEAGELWEAIYSLTTPSPPPGLTDHVIPSPKQTTDFDHAIVMISTCLAEKHGFGYRLVHQSVVEFFRTWSEELLCNDPVVLQLLLEPGEAHCLLANACLSYLVNRIPAQPLSGDMRQGVSMHRIRNGFPLVKYACLYWTHHLKEFLECNKDAIQARFQHSAPSVTRGFLNLVKTLSLFLANKLFANTWVELQYMVCSHTDLLRHINDLGDCCDVMESLPTTSLPKGLRELLGKITYLHRDILALNSAWGPTLEENPHYIWNDITAFQESSSFMKTSAVTVRSMAPSQFDSQILTSKPLISLSKERDDGKMVGVLSVWPPKSFEEAWPKATESKVEGLTCEGWIARFEVWDVHSEAKDKVNDIRIPLSAIEVKDHVGRSITLRKVLEGRTNRTTPTVFNRWSMPFPAAIGSHVNLLIILNTVYLLDLTLSEPVHEMSLPAPEADSNLSATNSQNGKAQKQPRSRPLRESLRLAQSHSFIVSNNSRYILRLDARSLVSTTAGEPTVYSVTAIMVNQTEKICSVIAQVGGNNAGMNINSCSFHPTLPLVLFFTRGFGGGRSIMLWAFTAESHNGQDSNISTHGKLETLSNIGPSQTGIEYLHFSSCGTNVVVKCSGRQLPEVYSLQTNPIYNLSIRLQQEDLISSSTTEMYSTDTSLLYNPDQSRIHQGQSLIRNSSAYRVNLSQNRTQSHLELTKVSNDAKTHQHLVSFPNSWKDLDNSIDITLSKANDTDRNVRMMINQGHKSWYEASEQQEAHFPIIVDKDSRAFLPA